MATPLERVDHSIPRRGLVHRIDVDSPTADIAVPAGVTDILLLLSHEDAVVGQSWIVPAGPVVPAARVEQAVAEHEGALQARRTRLAMERAFGKPAPVAPAKSIAVIVCTKDRPDHLRACLESLKALQHPRVDLLVVDNGSTTDATERLCAELGVRMVREPRPGQTSARNAGIASTSSDLVAFTDDDVIVDPGWLNWVEQEFLDPLTMIATGYIGPGQLETEAQVQFEAHGGFLRLPDRTLLDPEEVGLTYGASNCGAGANMVIRRELFDAIGGFDETFGAGTPTRTADDKLFFFRTLEAGYRIRYDPARAVWHQHRSDPEALSRIMRDYGTGEFTWPAHLLLTAGNLAGVKVWQWWLQHFFGDVRRWRRGDIAGIPPRYTLDEIRGMLAGPRALRSVHGNRPAGGPRAGTGWAGRSAAPEPTATADRRRSDAAVVSELPTITVAIGSYNRRAALERVLRKLALQTHPVDRYEVLVVLDGSTDGSAEMVKNLDLGYDLRLIEQPNRGLAATRNTGAAEAKHDLVVFLDDDIEPRPGYLSGHALAHAGRSEDTWVMGYFPPVVGHSYVEQGMRTWWERHFARKRAHGHRWSMVDMVDGNSSVPKRLFAQLGGFDTGFPGGRRQDYELGVRMLAAGVPMAFSDLAYADHCTKADTRTALNTAYIEGFNDAVLIAKHPQAWHESPIAITRTDQKVRSVWAVTERMGMDRCIAVCERLEALNRRHAWKRFMGAAWTGRYVAGFEAGSGGAVLTAPDPSHRRKVAIDIEAPDPSAVPARVADVDFVLHRAGVAVATIPALVPGQQWDWDDLVARAAYAALNPQPEAGRRLVRA